MALPVHAGAGTYIEGSGNTVSLPAPAGVDAGHIVLASLYVDGIGNTVSGLPGDWAFAPGSPVFAQNHANVLMWHRATGPESGPYVFTLSGSVFRAGRTHRITGCKPTGTPWDVFAADVRNTNGTVTPAVSIATAGPDELVVWAATCWGGGPWTPPTGFVERQDDGFGHVTLATKDQALSGSTGAVTGTSGGNDKQTAWMSALLPVTESAGGPMNIAEVMDELAAKLETIAGLRVWPYPPGSVTPPAAIVSYPDSINFDETYGRGFDRMKLPVVLVSGKPTDRTSRLTLAGFTDVTGVRSVKKAIETGPYTAFDDCRVVSVEFDVVELGGVDYMAAIFDIDLVGPGV